MFCRHGDSQVSEREREPSDGKIAPKAVVGRMSLYLRQLETYRRQGPRRSPAISLANRFRSRTPRFARTSRSSVSSAIRASGTGSTS